MSDTPNDRPSPEERYQRDVEFKTLVDLLTDAITRSRYTLPEIFGAAMFAATRSGSHGGQSSQSTARDMYPRLDWE